MNIDDLGGTGACSTLMLYNFAGTDTSCDLKTFIKKIDKSYEWFGGDGSEYELNDFAFVTASTEAGWTGSLHKNLKALGFTQTEPTYNKKNGTTVIFWVIPAPLLLNNMKRVE